MASDKLLPRFDHAEQGAVVESCREYRPSSKVSFSGQVMDPMDLIEEFFSSKNLESLFILSRDLIGPYDKNNQKTMPLDFFAECISGLTQNYWEVQDNAVWKMNLRFLTQKTFPYFKQLCKYDLVFRTSSTNSLPAQKELVRIQYLGQQLNGKKIRTVDGSKKEHPVIEFSEQGFNLEIQRIKQQNNYLKESSDPNWLFNKDNYQNSVKILFSHLGKLDPSLYSFILNKLKENLRVKQAKQEKLAKIKQMENLLSAKKTEAKTKSFKP